jgi:hypothetical protein
MNFAAKALTPTARHDVGQLALLDVALYRPLADV